MIVFSMGWGPAASQSGWRSTNGYPSNFNVGRDLPDIEVGASDINTGGQVDLADRVVVPRLRKHNRFSNNAWPMDLPVS